MADNRARFGMVTGSMVGLVFGLVFIEVNGGGLQGSWPLVGRVAGVVVTAALAAGVFWVARNGNVQGDVPEGGFTGRRYWNIVGFEGLALFGGLVVINAALGEPKFAVPWIALVVAVHFVVLGQAWRIPLYRTLGYVQSLLGVAGFGLAATGATLNTVNVVAGVLSGVALFATVAVAVVRSRPVTV